MHHVIARLQVRHVGGEGGELRFGGPGLGDQVGRIEKIFGSEDGDLRFRKNDAAPHQSFDQERAGGCAGDVGTLGEIRARGVGRIEAQLEGNCVLLENVGQPLQFARRIARRRPRDSRAPPGCALRRWRPGCCRGRPSTAGRPFADGAARRDWRWGIGWSGPLVRGGRVRRFLPDWRAVRAMRRN